MANFLKTDYLLTAIVWFWILLLPIVSVIFCVAAARPFIVLISAVTILTQFLVTYSQYDR